MRKRVPIIIVMILSLASVVLVTYLIIRAHEPKLAYYSVSESYTADSHVGVICDGEYLYDYDYVTGEKTNKRLTELESSGPALFLLQTDTELDLVPDESAPYTYRCSQDVISSYINKLLGLKYSIESYNLTSEYIDYMLYNKNNVVRVIWKVDGTCYIFCIDDRKNYTSPPYING